MSLKEHALAASAVIAAAAAGLTLWIQWDEWIAKKQRCQLAGTIFSQQSGQPIAGARIGFSPFANSTESFIQLGKSGVDGTFSTDCRAAQEYWDSSFVLLVTPFCGDPLPDLRTYYTYQSVPTTGTQAGLNVEVPCFE